MMKRNPCSSKHQPAEQPECTSTITQVMMACFNSMPPSYHRTCLALVVLLRRSGTSITSFYDVLVPVPTYRAVRTRTSTAYCLFAIEVLVVLVRVNR
eukprot:scaffold393208_cov18-Prasinocladus_malaysianus.AAC.1